MLKVAKDDDRYMLSLLHTDKLNTLFSELISQQLYSLVSVSDRHVIFQMEGIHHINKEGFKILLEATQIAAAVRCTFQISNISDEVKELIELQNLKDSFNITELKDLKEKIALEELDE